MRCAHLFLYFVLFVGGLTSGASAQAPSEPPKIATPAADEINEEEIAKDSNTEINVKNADIAAIVRIFGRKTKRNYILDERVKGKVSIYLPGKVSSEESIRILDSVLAYKGFSAVPIGENLWKIVPAKEAKQSTIPTILDSPEGEPSRSMVTRLMQLQYVSADEVRQLVAQLISPDGFLNAYSGTNSLVLIDTEDNIERIIGIIKTLDIPFTDREMTIIPIKYADAVDIATKLNDLLNQGQDSKAGTDAASDLLRARAVEAALTGRPPTSMPQGGAAAAGGGAVLAAGGTVQSRAKQPKISADERTNSVIVVADEDTTARIRALIAQLDTKLDLSGTRFYVYHCQHAKADELANVLSGLVGESAGTSGRGGSSSGALTPSGGDLISGGSNSMTTSRSRGDQFSRTQDRLQSQQRTPGRSRSENSASGGSKTAAIGENISITADPATNSLIIVAGKTDYLKIRELLEQLDVKRRQVLVEATLLEVGLDESKDMSMSFITSGGGADGAFLAQNNGANIGALLSNPSAVQDFSIAAASAGTITIGGENGITIPSHSILLEAARSNSNVNVLSAPTILTTDNEQAEIVVGQNVPFLASTATSGDNLSNTFNQIDRQDVGITLRLTPQISSTNSVTLKIFTEVSSVVSTDPRLGPTTSLRTSETNVITKDGQMVVIGGLMSDEINDGESGVPYLSDIPVLGNLFRSSSERRRRANLLILITPRVIRDQFDARDVTLENAGRVESEMKTFGIYPSREEVLNDMRMDRVTEPKVHEGEKPTTIRGPGPQAAEDESSLSKQPFVDNERHSEVLEFRVNPKFPDSSHPSSAIQDEQQARGSMRAEVISPQNLSAYAASTEALSRSTAQPLPGQSTGALYVVLKGTIPDELKNSLPFTVGKENTIGIVVPSDARNSMQASFSAGKSLAYRIDDRDIWLQVLSVSPNMSNTQDFHRVDAPQGSSQVWYTLSPYEIMNFGQGPWIVPGK